MIIFICYVSGVLSTRKRAITILLTYEIFIFSNYSNVIFNIHFHIHDLNINDVY